MLTRAGLLCSLVLLGSVLVLAYKDYKDYQIYNVTPTDHMQLKLLQQLSKEQGYDFFALSKAVNMPSRILVSPEKVKNFLSTLIVNGVQHTRLVEDVSIVLAQQRLENAKRTFSNNDNRVNVFDAFYTNDEINLHLESLVKAYPMRVFLKTCGRSHEGRPINIVTITNGDGRAGKKVIFVDSTIHAREWIAPSTLLHVINELLENPEQNANLLKDYDWVLMPVVNPDGYEYTHVEDRYQRKTRRVSVPESGCVGTDANRNFDFHWNEEYGASDDPCEEIYQGEKPFSEPETQVLRDVLWTYQDRLVFYMTLHSYGNYILLPWGYQSELPGNYEKLLEVAEAGASAIANATGSGYTYGSIHSIMWFASGSTVDYAAGVVKVPVSLALELPGGGYSGFDPSVSDIEEIVTETWIGIKAMAEYVVEHY